MFRTSPPKQLHRCLPAQHPQHDIAKQTTPKSLKQMSSSSHSACICPIPLNFPVTPIRQFSTMPCVCACVCVCPKEGGLSVAAAAATQHALCQPGLPWKSKFCLLFGAKRHRDLQSYSKRCTVQITSAPPDRHSRPTKIYAALAVRST